ncbi:Immunoglobulin-like domain [Sergentomyia squamirostris]
MYVKSGSSIRIVCRIPQGPHDLGNVFWYKGGELLQATHANEVYADKTQRITIDTDWVAGLTSRLIIQMAVPSDTGNYTCVPTTVAKPGSVYVHVIIVREKENVCNTFCQSLNGLYSLFESCGENILLRCNTIQQKEPQGRQRDRGSVHFLL